jgi:cell wall-associated NlpC family hydrolase
VPNFSDWQPADIVLVGNDGTLAGNSIVALQYASLSAATRAGAKCTHAALYVGNGMLIDATAGAGIAEHTVWDYCQFRALMLRRVPGLSRVQSDNIVRRARSHLGSSYSWLGVIASKLIPQTEPNPDRLYCSTFIGLVVAQGSGRTLASMPRYKPLHPGTLAGHAGLDRVELEWRPV